MSACAGPDTNAGGEAQTPEPWRAEGRDRRPLAVTQACVSLEDRCLSPQSPGLWSVAVPVDVARGRTCASLSCTATVLAGGRWPEDCALRSTGQGLGRGLAREWGCAAAHCVAEL